LTALEEGDFVLSIYVLDKDTLKLLEFVVLQHWNGLLVDLITIEVITSLLFNLLKLFLLQV
jgi:hypothetical protein